MTPVLPTERNETFKQEIHEMLLRNKTYHHKIIGSFALDTNDLLIEGMRLGISNYNRWLSRE